MARIAILHSVEYYETLDYTLTGWDQIPFGLSLVSACLERAGHEVRCWVVCPRSQFDRIAREIVYEFGCDMVGAGAVTTQFATIAHLCQRIKELKPSIPVLLGGVHASIRPEECIGHPAIDAVCVGEGEDVAVAWAKAVAAGVQPSGIPGLWIKIHGTGELDCSPPAPFRTDLDELPLINYGHWERWVDPRNRALRMVVGRGCPYSCTYCSNHALRRVQAGSYVRFRSPANVVSELRMLVERFPDANSVYLELETIGSSMAWALQLCDHLAAFNAEREHPIEFRANLSVTTNLVQQEDRLHTLLSAFRRANLRTLNVGLESGSERIRAEILNRPPYTNAALIRFCDEARKFGISVALYILVGVPTETAADAAQTGEVARACQPVEIDPSIYYPYPGTRLHDISADMRLFAPDHLSGTAERSRVRLKLKDFPAWRVFFEYVVMTWRVYHGRRKPIWVMRKVMATAFKILPRFAVASRRVTQMLKGAEHPHEIPAKAEALAHSGRSS